MRAAVYLSRCPCSPCPCRVVSGCSNVDPVAKPKVPYPSVVEGTSTVCFFFLLTTTGSLVSTSKILKNDRPALLSQIAPFLALWFEQWRSN